MVLLYYRLNRSCSDGCRSAQNLQRRLQLLSDEAEQGLNRVCGHELWKSVGPDAVDGVEDPDRRAEANYWDGQWKVGRELQEAIG